ncbi:tyrosine-type recombinase/integrase [Vibrio sp. HN007]|uniref:phage integrase n=1 Tax=Vibrio iocasae TaxID=3098914 RepID=UPI0035D42104
MSVRNLKDNSPRPWLCECYPNGRSGKRVRKRFATKGEATAYERYLMKETDEKPWLGNKPDHRRLSELLERWWLVRGQNNKSGLKTYNLLKRTVRELGNPIASHLTTHDYLNYRASRGWHHPEKRDKPVSPTTLNVELGNFKAMFNTLIKYGDWKLPNPVGQVEEIRVSEREMAYLTKENTEPFLEEVSHCTVRPRAKQAHVICKICLATGARVGEAAGLKRSHISKHKVSFIDTKGKKNRSVPISESLYKEILDIAVSDHQVFDIPYNAINAIVKNSLPDYVPKGQATHVMRHTFASHFMMNGGNILVLQRILGHKKIEQTMVYAHFAPEHLIEAVSLNPLEN